MSHQLPAMFERIGHHRGRDVEWRAIYSNFWLRVTRRPVLVYFVRLTQSSETAGLPHMDVQLTPLEHMFISTFTVMCPFAPMTAVMR